MHHLHQTARLCKSYLYIQISNSAPTNWPNRSRDRKLARTCPGNVTTDVLNAVCSQENAYLSHELEHYKRKKLSWLTSQSSILGCRSFERENSTHSHSGGDSSRGCQRISPTLPSLVLCPINSSCCVRVRAVVNLWIHYECVSDSRIQLNWLAMTINNKLSRKCPSHTQTNYHKTQRNSAGFCGTHVCCWILIFREES